MQGESFSILCKSKGYSEKDVRKFNEAATFMLGLLSGQRRLSGDSVSDHNLRVGEILVENSASPEVVLAGLLHGLTHRKAEIEKHFGAEVYSLIDGVEDIKRIRSKNRSLEADAVKKVLLTTLKDVRVILIKLANKLDNLKTISPLPSEKQQEIASDALEIYAPLAYRMGVERIRNELEDLSLAVLKPDKFEQINSYLKESAQSREREISQAIDLIKQALGSHVRVVKIKGRPKHIYSIFKKMTLRNVPLDQQHDLMGVRIIVDDVKDCYTVLAILHEKFVPVEGRLKDYIAKPKPNLYRSIHTGLLIIGKLVEVQIRTVEMDELAEEGIAAHWKYKGLKGEESFEKKVGWLKGILDLQKEGSKEFLEAAKVDVFGDVMYCYTPKGDLKELPRGSSVLDFGFRVHEQVGSRAVGAKVNGQFVPLRHELRHGDIVEIITNKNQRPSRSWLKWTITGHARQKIRRYITKTGKAPAPRYKLPRQKEAEQYAALAYSKEYPEALCELAKCCNPVPGESISGLITKRRVISVHKASCKQLLKESERLIIASWKDTFDNKIRFTVKSKERSGLLADLLHTIANAGFQVSEAKAKLLSYEEMECSFLVMPRELESLKDLIKRISKVKGVSKIHFGD